MLGARAGRSPVTQGRSERLGQPGLSLFVASGARVVIVGGMPNVILYLRDGREGWYLEYSTVVDAPTTGGMRHNEMLRHLAREYGRADLKGHKARLARAHANGSSYRFDKESAEDVIRSNRAGPGELSLTKKGILDLYCRDAPDWPDWSKPLARVLREWLYGAENKVGDVEPAILESVEYDGASVSVFMRSNAGKDGEVSFVIHSGSTAKSIADQCRTARDTLYGKQAAA